jgi:hypothetical protein
MDKKSRAKNLAHGKCCHCPEEVVPGQLRCLFHLNYQKNCSAKRRIKWFEQKQCVRCGAKLHDDMDAGYKHCLNCREGLNRL